MRECKLLSVIIPVYNVRRYLRQCLESLLNQTLYNMEIICVDDCSDDGSNEILYEYKAKDKRIDIITNPHNLGAGASRNIGIDTATGKYLAFLDSDDYFDPSMLKSAYDEAISYDADVVLWDWYNIDEKSGNKKLGLPLPLFVTNWLKEHPAQSLDSEAVNFISLTPWSKLVKREFVMKHNLRFQNIANSNDVYFGYMCLLLAQRVCYLPQCLMYHRVNRQGQISEYRGSSPICAYKALQSIKEAMEEKGMMIKQDAFRGRAVRTLAQTFAMPGSTPCVLADFYKFLSVKGFSELGLVHLNDSDFNAVADFFLLSVLQKFSNPYLIILHMQNLFFYLLTSTHIKELTNYKYEYCLWGYGHRGQYFLYLAAQNNLEINCIIDTKPTLQGKVSDGITIFSPEKQPCSYDAVIVTNYFYLQEVMEKLINFGKTNMKIIDFDSYVCWHKNLYDCIYSI